MIDWTSPVSSIANIAILQKMLYNESRKMTVQEWVVGRNRKGLTQVRAAKMLGVSQAYLSQLENGSRVAGDALARKAADFYQLPTAIPLPKPNEPIVVDPEGLQKDLAALGYPKFSHVFANTPSNPARVV